MPLATTKIWPVRDSLRRVVDYAANPDKTEYSGLAQALHYAENDSKTTLQETAQLVSGIHCRPATAWAEKKQMVPFVLWANYDIPEAQGVELSLNYLSALLMDTANLPMTGYQKYLARLWEAAPVINTVGIRDAGGNWYGENEALPEELDAAVEDYRVLLYSNVFDKKDRPEGFFALTE